MTNLGKFCKKYHPCVVISEIIELFEKKNIISDCSKKQITSGDNKLLLPPEVTNI